MMGRIDWLRDVGAGFGKAVLAITLEICVFFDGKRRMGRIWREKGDWGRLGKDELEEKWTMIMGRSGCFYPYKDWLPFE